MTKNNIILALVIALGVTSPAIVGEFRGVRKSTNLKQTTGANWPSAEEEETFMSARVALMMERAELYASRSKRLANGEVVEQGSAGFHTLRVVPHNSESLSENRSQYLPEVVSGLVNFYGFLDHADPTGQARKMLTWGRTFPNILVSDVALSVDPNNLGMYRVTGKFPQSSIETLSQLIQTAPGSVKMQEDGVDWADEARNAGEYVSNFQVAIIMDNIAFNAISVRDIVEANDPNALTLLADSLTFQMAELLVDRLGN